MHAYLNTASKIARSASKILLRNFDNLETNPEKREVQMQKLREKLETVVYADLHETYPDHEIAFPGLVVKSSPDNIVWQIEVLSGELNFRHGIAHFAMAFTIREQNKIQHALIYDPILQEMFTATRGTQAQMGRKRLRVNPLKEFNEALIASNFNVDHDHLRRSGCPALDLAYVAAGRYDAFVSKELSVFETAAGCLLIKVAGGIISDWQGGENSEATGELVATNTKLIKPLLQKLN